MATVALYALDESATIDDALFDVTDKDYKPTVLSLLPFGLAWNPTPNGLMDKLLCALAKMPSRVEKRGLTLIEEMDVRTTEELLDDWERVLGLPGDCDEDPPTTLEDRREAAHAKLTGRDEINEGFFLNLAEDLGYPGATIRPEHNPFQMGVSVMGDSFYSDGGHWTYTFTLILANSTPNDGQLQCLVREYAQAHEIVHFEYPGQAAGVYIIEGPR